MSHSISTLLIRNLRDVFGENDPARRRATIDEIFTEDCVFYEPRGVYRGRDEIDRVAGAIKATHPDFRYQAIAEPEELGNTGRIQWNVARRRCAVPDDALDRRLAGREGRFARSCAENARHFLRSLLATALHIPPSSWLFARGRARYRPGFFRTST